MKWWYIFKCIYRFRFTKGNINLLLISLSPKNYAVWLAPAAFPHVSHLSQCPQAEYEAVLARKILEYVSKTNTNDFHTTNHLVLSPSICIIMSNWVFERMHSLLFCLLICTYLLSYINKFFFHLFVCLMKSIHIFNLNFFQEFIL